MNKHCPYCKHLLVLPDNAIGGTCDRCHNNFLVKYHLTKIRLVKVFIPRDYEMEILNYIKKKNRTYAVEISSSLVASKGRVSITLRSLENQKKIKVIRRGKTKWIELTEEEK